MHFTTGQYILLNSHLTLDDGQEYNCTEDGLLLRDNNTSIATEDLKRCHDKSCWPGVQCVSSESGMISDKLKI